MFFNHRFVVIARYILFVLFLIVLIVSISGIENAKLLLLFYVLFLVNEFFVYLRLNKMRPLKKVSQVDEQSIDLALFYRPRLVADRAHNAYDMIESFLSAPDISFIARKIDGEFHLGKTDLTVDEVKKRALQLVNHINGKYITHLDLFTAYMLLTEHITNLLRNADMTLEDLVNIYYWARNAYEVDAKNKPYQSEFYGDGAFDFFIYGWNAELKKYATSITSQVLSAKHPPTVIGRAKEYEELLVNLSKVEEANVLLVGDPGTGKTSLVEYFAYNAHLGRVPGNLAHWHVYELAVDRLLAGVENRGELTDRLVYLIAEISHSGNVILFIQNIENIFGAGGFDFDLSGVLYQYLEKRSIQIIGTTTQGAYKTYIAPHESTASVFSVIDFPEPDRDTALFMLFEKMGEIEKQYKLDLTYPAVKTLVALSDSYLPDRRLPGKAISVLLDIATSVTLKNKRERVITKEDVEAHITQKTHILVGEPTSDEKQLLLQLEEKMHERVISQDAAVVAIAKAMRRVRSGFARKNRPIASFLFLGPTGVGKTETAKALAQLYFGDEEAMIRLDMSEYQMQDSLPKLLGESVGGQYAEHSFVEKIRTRPFSLVLLDEFEKAHPQILNLFLQVLEDGRLTDNKGITVSFQNTIIIATSNAGSEFIRQHEQDLANIDSFKKTLLDTLLSQHTFSPELVNRFDDVVVFKPLTQENLKQIAVLLLQSAFLPLQEKHITVNFDTKLIDKMIAESYDPQFGARNIRRYIDSNISDFVSQLILNNQIDKGSTITLSVDSNGQIGVL